MWVTPRLARRVVPQLVKLMNHAVILPIGHRLAMIPRALTAVATVLVIEVADAPFTRPDSSSLEVAGVAVMLSIHKLRGERFHRAAGKREPR